MKQSCYFAKVCDAKLNKKHIGVNLFSLQLCVFEKLLKILRKKGTKFVSRCWRSLLEDFKAEARSFNKSPKLLTFYQIPNFTHVCLNFHLDICRVSQQINIFSVQ